MRKWGTVISLFYALIVLGLLVPAGSLLAGDEGLLSLDFYRDLISAYRNWLVWAPVAIVLSGQVILLFLSVDASFKRLKPRAHLAVSITVGAMLFALLTFAVTCSIGVAIPNNNFVDALLNTTAQAFGVCGILWGFWGVVFYLYFRNSNEITMRIVSWLLKGSVLELLIAVPCHVIVRRRHDCSAPIVTSFGITTGLAVMLLCFGPSVLLLYKKRMDAYATRSSK